MTKWKKEIDNLPEEFQQYAAQSKYAAKKGFGMSPADIQSALLENNINIANYEKYESIPAQVQQMKDAGLNPALMYGGSNGAMAAPDVSADAGTAAGVGVSDPASLMSSVIGMISGSIQDTYSALGMKEQLEGLKLKNEETRANIRNKNEQTVKTALENKVTSAAFDDIVSSYGVLNKLNIAKTKSEEQNVKNLKQAVEESLERMKKMESDIEVNGSTIKLNDARALAEKAKARLDNMTASEMKRLNDSLISLRSAQAGLFGAQTQLTQEQADNYSVQVRHMEAEISKLLLGVELDEKLSEGYDNAADNSSLRLFALISSIIPGAKFDYHLAGSGK